MKKLYQPVRLLWCRWCHPKRPCEVVLPRKRQLRPRPWLARSFQACPWPPWPSSTSRTWNCSTTFRRLVSWTSAGGVWRTRKRGISSRRCCCSTWTKSPSRSWSRRTRGVSTRRSCSICCSLAWRYCEDQFFYNLGCLSIEFL